MNRLPPTAERAIESPEVVEEPGIAAVTFGSGELHGTGYAVVAGAPVTRTSDSRYGPVIS